MSYPFIFNNSYFKTTDLPQSQQEQANSGKEAAPGNVSSDKVVTGPINGASSSDAAGNLTESGNVPLATNNSGSKTDGLELKSKEYMSVNIDKLPQKNTFYNTLEQYHKGFKKLSVDEKRKVFAQYLQNVAPEQREAVARKMFENGRFKEVDEFMTTANKELGDNAIVTNHVALTGTKKGSGEKKVVDNLVANHYTEANENSQVPILKDIYENAGKEAKVVAAENSWKVAKSKQLSAAQVTADQSDKDVAAAGASATPKFAKENQVQSVKIYRNLDNEKVDMAIAKVEGQYAIENQQAIYASLMKSSYKSVVKCAANGIYTLDKSNQDAAAKMTMATGNKDAINAVKANMDKYDESCRSQIEKTVETTSTSSSSSSNAEEKSVTASNTTTSDITELKQSISKNNGNSEKIAEILNNTNPVQQIALLKTMEPAQAIALAKLIKNPSLEIIELMTDKAKELSIVDQGKLVAEITSNRSSSNLVSLFENCHNDELKGLCITNCRDLSLFRNIDKNRQSDNVREDMEKRLNNNKNKIKKKIRRTEGAPYFFY